MDNHKRTLLTYGHHKQLEKRASAISPLHMPDYSIVMLVLQAVQPFLFCGFGERLV
jgi:hypothetical protein